MAQAPRTWLEPITVLAALGGVDQPGRADRHRLDHLHRAVQPGAPVRLDRPHQQRPRRLEHRDLVAGDRGARISAAAARSAMTTATPAAKNSWRWSRRCGTAGPPTPCIDDRASGLYARPDRIRPINHRGDFYNVAGPLNMPRCPQGRPVLVQAGSSDTGRRFAARHAEAVFTAHMAKATAQEFYADLKSAGGCRGPRPGAGADPAGPQPDDRRRPRPRRSGWRARSTS